MNNAIAILNDTHFGVRADNQNFINNQLDFFRSCFFPVLKSRGIKRVFFGGDLFDRRKNVDILTMETFKKEVFDIMQNEGIEVTAIVGNHDCRYKNTNEHNSIRTILCDYKNWDIIDRVPEERKFSWGKVGFVPWICDENAEASMKFLETSNADVILGHFEIMGFDFFVGQPCLHGLDREVFSRFKKVLSGHFHTRSQQGNITYLGSQYEMTWADCDDPKGFHILDGDTFELEFVPFENPMFYRLVLDFEKKSPSVQIPMALEGKYVKLIVKGESDKKLLEKYVAAIQLQNPADFKVVENEPSYVVSDETTLFEFEDTMSLMRGYVNAVDMPADVNKTSIIGHLSSLYTEALQVE